MLSGFRITRIRINRSIFTETKKVLGQDLTVVSSSLDIVNLVFTQRNRSAFIEFTFAALHHAMPCTRVAASSIVCHHISMHQVTCGSLQYCCKHSILPPLGIKVNEGLRQILKFKHAYTMLKHDH